LTVADIQLGFVVEAALARGVLGEYANLQAFGGRIQARPAYRRAVERGGPYKLGR
jgi:glutathione S-transferase